MPFKGQKGVLQRLHCFLPTERAPWELTGVKKITMSDLFTICLSFLDPERTLPVWQMQFPPKDSITWR